MVERAKSHEHTDGMDLWRCNDSQQWENVLITEHPVRERGGGQDTRCMEECVCKGAGICVPYISAMSITLADLHFV